jgi:hypothetical protein
MTLSFAAALRRRCAKTRTRSWWAKCATWKPSAWPDRRRNRPPGVRHPAHLSRRAKTIDRIIDVFPAEEKEMVRAMLSESLQAVISQTLCKTKDGRAAWRRTRS